MFLPSGRHLPFVLILTTLVGMSEFPGAFAEDRLPIPAGRACPLSTDFIIPGTRDGLVAPFDLIWAEWMRIGGPEGPIGCPIGGLVKDAPGGGGFMQFEHGQIAVS